MKIKNACKILVRDGVPFLAMPDGTIIPHQLGMTIVDKMEEPTTAKLAMLATVEVEMLVQWVDTIERGQHLHESTGNLNGKA